MNTDTNLPIVLNIDCVPPTATAQGKRIVKCGKFHKLADNANTAQAKHDLMALVLDAKSRCGEWRRMEGPVELRISFQWPYRKSERKTLVRNGYVIAKTTKPDCSNIIKIIEDCLTRAGLWNDDAQVVRLTVRKTWGPAPGITIEATEIVSIWTE